ncbi:unnamed protein product [Hymenolepis diminuta]|uniref:Uncharacterized protein n=1 Tax=Hymenolepis diminuta TaxID=6216 RepID=A0A564Y9Y8_HYMDI|nr:unnamed protein product [Hymenolepis diminuta]
MRQVATEATRSAKAPWKDIESGKVGTTIEETKIELRNSCQIIRRTQNDSSGNHCKTLPEIFLNSAIPVSNPGRIFASSSRR